MSQSQPEGGQPLDFKAGGKVKLREVVEDYPMTMGKVYTVKYLDGSSLCVSTDDPHRDATLWRGRFLPVS